MCFNSNKPGSVLLSFRDIIYRYYLICFVLIINIIIPERSTAQISISATDTPYFQDFNTLVNSGSSTTVPSGWAFSETGIGANGQYIADDGNSSAADAYSYGTGTNADRAFGELTSPVFTNIGASFTNNTGVTITSLLVQYYGEQWRISTNGRPDSLKFQYSTNATSLSTGTWTNVTALHFAAPVTAGGPIALDGNATANRTLKGTIITGLSITNGSTFWIKWIPFSASGTDDGLAVDDFILSANPQLHYQISTASSNLTVTDIDGNGETIDVTESGANIQFYVPGRTYSLNSGATTVLPFQTSIAGVNSITCSTGAGADTIEVGAFATSMKDLTLNGGTGNDLVRFNGDITFTVNEKLNVDLQNDDPTPGTDQVIFLTDADLALSGNGSAVIRTSRNVLFNTTSSLVTTNGDITIEANLQTTPTSGTFAGISIAGGLVQVTGTGDINIEGKGGTGPGGQHGVHLSSDGDIIGGTAGTASIIGRAGAATSSSNMGVFVTGSVSSITSGGANISVEGYGSTSGGFNYGIQVASGGLISAGGSGTVTVEGTGGTVTSVTNDGIRVIGTNSMITSSGGNVTVTGVGGGSGSASTNPGVNVSTGGKISAGGSGAVSVTGSGGNTTGINNFGVQVTGTNAMITSSGGSVTVIGNGGGTTSTTNGFGITISNGGTITAGASGNVTVIGTGSMTSGNNQYGVHINGATSSITSNGGSVSITGEGGGAGTSGSCYGVNLISGMISAGGTANIFITGTGGAGSSTNNVGVSVNTTGGLITSGGGNVTIVGHEGGGSSGYGIITAAPADISTSTNGGDITLKANSILINGAISSGASDSVVITPFDDFPCHVGPTTNIIGGPLHLSDTELDSVVTGHLVLGSVTAGQVIVNDTITRTVQTHMYLRSVEEVDIDGGYINTAGGNLVLDPGTSSTGAYPDQSGTDAFINTISCAGKLHFVINGLVADTDFEQLNITGSVNLNGATLVTSGTHTPAPGQTFMIINNDGADPVTGTFAGLAQGSYVTAFLGSNYPAQISYTGGDGNDVVLTVGNPDYIITTAGNNFILTDMAGNSDNLTVSHIGADMNLSIGGRTYSLNGAAVTTFPVNVPFASLNALTFNLGLGSDQIYFNTFLSNVPDLTVNGGQGNDLVTFLGDLNFIADADLDLDLQNDDASPGTDNITFNNNANVKLFGNGHCTIKASRSVDLFSGSSVETVNGNLTIELNQQASSTTGSFAGLACYSGLIQVTGSGLLSILSKGGASGTGSHGILLNGGDVLGGTTGTTSIIAQGGTGGGSINFGVYLLNAGASINTFGSNLNLSAYGGTGASGGNYGLYILSGNQITAGGSGTVSVHSEGGDAGGANIGIYMLGASMITSTNGNVTVTGLAGDGSASSQNIGVYISGGSMIKAGGSGHTQVTGTGGSSSQNFNYGVLLGTAGSSITSNAGNVTVVGQGGGNTNAQGNYGIYLVSNCSISAGSNGHVSVTGTGGHTNGVDNHGVLMETSSSSITSGGGNVSVQGTGGNGNGFSNHGVYLRTGADISAGVLGTVTVTGQGGQTTAGAAYGIFMDGTGTTITSNGGNIQVTGTGGGTGTNSNNVGVLIFNSSQIVSTDNATISVTATAGNTQGSNTGLLIYDSGSIVSNGNLTVSGTGAGTGSSNSSIGIHIHSSGAIIANDDATLTITAQGGPATGNNQYGLQLANAGSVIAVTDGSLFINASGGLNGGNSSIGLYLTTGGDIVSLGTGHINIVAAGGLGTGINSYGMYVTGGGTTITTIQSDLNINTSGGGTGSAMNGIGLYMAAGASMETEGTGNINITTIGGSGTGTGNYGMSMVNSAITSHDGDVMIITSGGGQVNSSSNFGASITSGALISTTGTGNISIDAEGGNSNGGGNYGLFMSGASNGLLTLSGSINIVATGKGSGTSSSNHGCVIQNGSQILAGGSGDVTLTATGGQGSGGSHLGLFILEASSMIASLNGNIDITGFAGGTGASMFNYGVTVYTAAQIKSFGSGNVSIQGTGGGSTGSDFNHGVLIGFNEGRVATSGGNMSITGFGGGSGALSDNNYGVFVFSKGSVKVGEGGLLLVQGTGGPGTGTTNIGVGVLADVNLISGGAATIINGIEGGGPNGLGLFFDSNASITTDSFGGNITLIANSIGTTASISTPDSNSVIIRPHTDGVSIHLGATTEVVGGPLRLGEFELDSIQTGLLKIGSTQTDSIIVVSDLDRTDTLDIILLAEGHILLDTGAILMPAGNLLLDCGPSPAAVMPVTRGVEVMTDTLSFGSDLLFNINGILPDSLFNQLWVTGKVNLTGVDLKFAGSYFPLYADTFLIVNNDGTDAIIGTFNGLAEGGIIPMFLGSNTPATITYTGGDGNDVVITVATPDYSITDSLGHLVVTDLKGNSDNMTMQEIGLDLRFSVAGRTYSYNYGPFATMPANIPFNVADSITLHLNGGNDVLTVSTVFDSIPSLIINGGAGNDNITMSSDLLFKRHAHLDVDLQDDDMDPGIDNFSIGNNANIHLFGNGRADVKVSRSIAFSTGSWLKTENGNLILEANQQATPTTGNYRGISFINSKAEITGTGLLSIKGKAGTANGVFNTGIMVDDGSEIIGGTTGTAYIEGTGGMNGAGENDGIVVQDVNSKISSNGADVHVTGYGGTSTLGNENFGVEVNFSASITAGGLGNVFVTGTGGMSTGDQNYGVRVIQSGIITSSGGNVTIIGTGNGSGDGYGAEGVSVAAAGIITAGGSGTVMVTGTGGPGTGNSHTGVSVGGVGALITTGGGNLIVHGTGGGSGPSGVNIGVAVSGTAKILGGGSGNVEIVGHGGLTQGGTNYGVGISQSGSLISSNGGNVNITGNGGGINNSQFNLGVSISGGATLSSGGIGHVHVIGTGGTTTGAQNMGIYVRNSTARITSAGGNVTLEGYGGGTGSAATGIGFVVDLTGIIDAGGDGHVDIYGQGGGGSGGTNRGIFIGGASTITSAGGNVTLEGQGGGVTSGSSNEGILIVSGSVVTAGGSGNVNVTGTGGNTNSSSNSGIELANSGSMITSSGGHVTVTGQGGSGAGSAQSAVGVQLETLSMITAGGLGNVSVYGTGGMAPGSLNIGVYLIGPGCTITSSGGDVLVEGIGNGTGSSGNNSGVRVGNASVISAGQDGTVSVTGQGGTATGASNYGVIVESTGSRITSTNADITVTGTGGGSVNSSNNYGIYVNAGGQIGAAGFGNTIVNGTGGNGNIGENVGVGLSGSNSKINANTGDIFISGTGGNSSSVGDNFGVAHDGAAIETHGDGSIFIEAYGGTGAGMNNFGFVSSGGGVNVNTENGNISINGIEGTGNGIGIITISNAGFTSDAGNIELKANSISLAGPVLTSAADSVWLHPNDAGIACELTSASDIQGGPLRLSDGELDLITAGTILIGDAVADSIVIYQQVTRPLPTNVHLRSADDIIFSTGTINTSNGYLLLDPGASPEAVRPLTHGVEVHSDTVAFGSDLAIRINGTTVDTQYDQLNVAGHIDINDVTLMWNGSYVPMEDDSFMIVKNDASDPVFGIFVGLPEGDTIPNFQGGTLPAVITYIGGDGNDVVIRVVQPCIAPEIPTISVSLDTICAGDMVTLTITAGNLGQATNWHWYNASCGISPVGTGLTIMVDPANTTTYYVRGEGGCVIAGDCGEATVVVNPYPDASFAHEYPDTCYYRNHTFEVIASEIPGADYTWTFGAGAIPSSATGYGPHTVYYTTSGTKTAKLVIHPNAPGPDCPDSSSITFPVVLCPGNILGYVLSNTGAPISGVNVKLFADADSNGVADNGTAIRNIFTPSNGVITMASLTPGHYVLSQTQPFGWNSLDDYDNTPDGDAVPNVSPLDNLIPVTILPLEWDTMNYFIEIGVPGSISGSVFDDFNGNQQPNSGEGLPDVIIHVLPDANTDGIADSSTPVKVDTTDAQGNYLMSGVPVGHYVIVEFQPPGLQSVKDFDASNDADVVPNTNQLNDTIPASITNAEVDANNYFIESPACGLIVNNTNDDGPGSLRQALSCGVSGDTIRFNPILAGATIETISDIITLDESIVLYSTLEPRITIASSIEGHFAIAPGAVVEFRGMNIISGLSPGNTGAAFENTGTLILHDVEVKRNPFFNSGEYLIYNHPGSELEWRGQCLLKNE